jgi:hypothetical protein
MRKMILLICGLAILSLPYCFKVTVGPNFGWQIKAGTDILREGRIETKDSFSYTAENQLWINHEWLSGVLFSGAFLTAGDSGLFFLRAGIFFLAVIFFGLLCWRRCPYIPAVLLGCWIAVPTLSRFINLRPQSFTYLFVLIFLFWFDTFRRRKTFCLWWVPVLMLVWANLHGGFALGLFVALISLAGFYFGRNGLERSLMPSEKASWLVILGLTAGAALVTPYGVNLFLYVAKELTAVHGDITEWMPLKRSQLPLYFSYTVLPLIIVYVSKKIRVETVLFFLSIIASACHRRFLILLVIFGTLVLFEGLGELKVKLKLDQWPRGLRKMISVAAIGVILIVLCPISLGTAWMQYRSGGFHLLPSPFSYPAGAIHFLKKNFIGPNLAVTYQWGEFIIRDLSPNYKVSIDSRNVTLYPSDYVATYLKAYERGDLSQWLGRYPVDAILVESGSPIAEAAFKSKRWVVIYIDSVAVIFVQKKSGDGVVLARRPIVLGASLPI